MCASGNASIPVLKTASKNYIKHWLLIIWIMKIHTEIVTIKTTSELELINISNEIGSIVSKSGISTGNVIIYSRHTTLAVKINEDEKLLQKDIRWLMTHIAPESNTYSHDQLHLRPDCPPDEPENAKGHLRCMLMETSQTVPIIDKALQLGTYQSIFAVETSGPRKRQILVQVLGE